MIAREQCRKVCLSSCDQPAGSAYSPRVTPTASRKNWTSRTTGDANVSHLRAPAEVAEHQIPIKTLGSVNGNTVEANLSALQQGN